MSEGGGRADVVIVGGGIIGCGIAWHLARRGVSVTVVERDRPGGHATWAAAGMLSPLGETASPGPFYDLVMASFRRYDAFVEALEEATGITVEYRESGKLCVALDESEAAELTERHRWQRAAGHEVELLDAGEARRLEPALAPSVVAGLLIPRDRQVDNRRLGRALWVAAARAGARFVLGDPVQSLWLDGPAGDPEGTGSAGGRVRGVALASGTRIEAPCVVLAAGSWSGRIPYAGRTLPVSPVGGQLLALETVPPVLSRVIQATRCYLVPRADGRLLVGATMERRGFSTRPTAGGVHGLLGSALRAVPGLANAPVVELWAGLRPGTPDGLPILGSDPDVAGLVHATGHLRNGILLAPITAELIADVVTGATPALPLEPFRVDRFTVAADAS